MASSKKSSFSPFLKQCFVTAAVGSNVIGHGCMLGYPGILLPQLAMVDSAIKLSPVSASWIASVLAITQLFGTFLTPPIMERYGRKIAHFAVIMPNMIGWLIMTLAYNFEMLLAARFLQGLSIGMMSTLRSVLIGEYTSPKNRGAFLTTVSLSQTFGIFLVHVIGSLLTWQLTGLMCVIFPLISLVMCIYSPESPSWLVKKGRNEDCKETFHWLRGDGEEEELDKMLQSRILCEKANISDEFVRKSKSNKFQKIFRTVKKPEFYKPIILMMHAYILLHFCGGTTMAAYPSVILYSLMGPKVNFYFWMTVLDGQRLVFNALAVFAMNKFKRRTMMFTTGALSILSQFGLAAYIYFKEQGLYDAFWVPVFLINLKMFTLAVGMLPVPNVIGGEVFPLAYRGIGGMISQVVFSGTFFLVLITFTSLVDSIGMHGVYMVYGGVITYSMAVIWILLPETKGKTLQQIEDTFRGSG